MADGELLWWHVEGEYQSMLIAAVSPERAIEFARERDAEGRWRAWDPTQALGCEIPPGPPTAEGIYFHYAE